MQLLLPWLLTIMSIRLSRRVRERLLLLSLAVVGFTSPPVIANGIETDGLANLVKVSKNGVPFYSATTNPNYAHNGASRASNISSTVPSLNGRVMTLARWNSHFLVTQDPIKKTLNNLDPTPVAAFPTPDWIIVTRSGASKVYADPSTLKDPSDSNTNYAIGRFAYAIYNEGGLLDMNAAGYPGALTPAQTSQKGSVAYADLTQLGLTQAQIDQIVAWRNPYTAQLSSATFGGTPTFNLGSWATNFVSYNVGLTNSTASGYVMNGFMGVNTNVPDALLPLHTASSGPSVAPTDQAFLSRQQLINLTQSLNIAPKFLQSLGTFSRSLEQPSYHPRSQSAPHHQSTCSSLAFWRPYQSKRR